MAQNKEKSKVPGALFIFDTWDKNKYGLPAFHRYLVKTLGKKKGKSLRLYSTVLSDEIGESHKQDAEELGVTLLMAERRKRIIPQDDPARLTWLHNFESYYPEFQKLNDIQYIIGYAPKTGDAAADIRDGAFPSAQLVLINHASPENDCTLVHSENLEEFEQRMLKMASEADLIFSMGPKHYRFFQNQYRVTIGKKDLQGTPHEEILPVPSKSFFKTKVTLGKSDSNCHVIFTYGTFDNANLVHGLKGVASAVGSVARTKHDDFRRLPDWDIHGVNKDFQEAISKQLKTNLSGELVAPRLFQDLTIEKLTTKLCQSHICLPIRCYGEYSFDGLEALALGVPLLIAEYSHLASLITEYFPIYEKHYVVRSKEQYPQMIKYILQNTETSFEIADAQKTEFKESKHISKSYKRFVAMLAYDLDSDNDNSDTISSKSKDQAATGEEKELKRQTLVPSEKESPDEECSQNHQMGDRRSLLNTSHESERVAHYPCGSNFTAESSMHRGTRGSDEILVKIKFNEDDFNKEIRRLDGQIQQGDEQTLQEEGQKPKGERQALEEQKRKIQNILEQIKKSYKERVYIILNQDERKLFLQFLLTHCNNNHAIFINVEEGCLALLLKFRFLQNLSKFRGSCLTGRFTKPLEQYLVTKEMRVAAKKAKIDLKLVPVYDDEVYQDIADFFIERDGGSDVTEDTTSSDDDGVDVGWLEAPFVVKCHSEDEEDESTKASDQLHVQALLAETEEKLHTNSRRSSSKSMEISLLQNERDNAIKEKCVVENRYRELLNEREKYRKQLTQMKMEVKRHTEDKESLHNEIYTLKSKERARKIEISELELNRHEHFTETSLEKMLESGNEDDSEQKFESKQRKIQLQKLDQEKRNVVEGQLQIAQRGKIPHDGIPSGQGNEISVQRNQEGLLRVSTATTGGTNNTVPGEMTQVSWSRVSNVKDTDTNEHASRPTQQLVSPLHLSKEQSTNLKADGEVTEPARVGEDLDNGCTSNRYSGIFQTLYHKWMGQKLTVSQKEINKEWSVQILGLQKPGTTQGMFNNPNGLRWHHRQLLICDTNNNRIQILAKNYYYQSVGEIRFDGQFQNAFQPWAVTVYRKEYYISDIGNNQINICDKCHEILQTIPVTSDISLRSITVMAGFAVVTDHKGNNVLRYNKKGDLVAKYQGQGSENTLIKYPHSVVATNNGSLLVSDTNSHNIKVLDPDLNYVESFCAKGVGNGEVRYPQGIDVDERGNIYVCDKLNNRIVKLGPEGNFLCNLFEGDLEYPTNIAVSAAGDEIAVSMFGDIARPVNQIRVFFKNKLSSIGWM